MSRQGGHRRGQAAAALAAIPEPPAGLLPDPPSPPPPLTPPAPSPPGLSPPVAGPPAPSAYLSGSVSTLAPITVAPPVAPRPVPTLVPTGRAQRRAALRERRRRQLRRVSLVGGVVAAVAAIVAGIVVTSSGAGSKKPVLATPSTVRTQHTVLLSLAPTGGAAIEGVLLAHDSANGQGAAVLVPADIVTEVAGHGTMAFGEAATFGTEVPGQTLSDMISVTVDGNWLLTPDALAALVDHLGGITADVPIDIPVNGQVVVAHGDGQQLTGSQAVAFATYLGADEPSAARLARFETVLVAILAKLNAQPAPVSTVLAGLATGSTMGTNTTVVSQVLGGLAADAKAQNVDYTTLPTQTLDTGDNEERLAVDGTGVAAMVKQYFAGSVPRGRVAGRNRVIVFNGTGQLGLGQSARDRLTAHGLVFIRSANQPGFGYQDKTSVVLVPDATPDSLAAGRRVAAALGLPASDVETATVDTTAADVITILGDDYKP
jgi:LytR cell envelope-related transcriptional attenuator/LytR_cpsA_psr family